MLYDSDGRDSMSTERLPERCEPDYESMVERINKKIAKTSAFKDAALDYFLVTEDRQLSQERYSLIKRQEAAKNNK